MNALRKTLLCLTALLTVIGIIWHWYGIEPPQPPNDIARNNQAAKVPDSFTSTHRKPAGMSTMDGTGNPRVEVTDAVREQLFAFATRPTKTVPLRKESRQRTRLAMRSWASTMMDLSKAKSRKSERFYRTTYVQDVSRDQPIYFSDRMGPDGALLGTRRPAGQSRGRPIKALYRESDSGQVLRLQKFKEVEIPGGEGLENEHAIEGAKAFFTENGFVEETETDIIAHAEIRERRTNGESSSGEISDHLEQQDIVLRREYEGKPVVNSSATIGVLPEDEEVTLIKVSNWTRVADEEAQNLGPETDDEEAREISQQLEDKVLALVRRESRGDRTRATIVDVQEGYYQHEDRGLIPILIFEVEVDPGTREPYHAFVLVNPYGDTEELWYQGREPGYGKQRPEQ